MWQSQQSPEPSRSPRNRTTIVAVAAATVVVVAAAVTGFLVLGDDGGDADRRADGKPTPQASVSADDTDRSGTKGGSGPQISGWKTVVNAKRGISFDVPPSWAVKSPDWVSYVAEDDDPDEKPLVAMMGPAVLKAKWCSSDDDKDGTEEHTELASTGTTGNNGAKNTAEAAEDTAKNWVYGAYTQPDRTHLELGRAEPYRTKSGLEGSLATVTSSGAPAEGKCDSDGKATTFAFENAEGDFVSWSLIGAHGVPDEVSDATVRKILSTVRLLEEGDGRR
ncbi:hypothetical protein DY218_05790 [Streptomyces triticagri]|uniref:DUF8017 domain-containing protein n=1 Tax=Streptomyces triticagri TaxID=2293568 RepID=A0A372M9Z3_9ACTN|nr:hypothetical protein [Streptomyces triticagri]RFU87764.1 hypothetical protein DY218_05790 [Streptomyces triticagri]